MLPSMNTYLFPTLFCLALCVVFVWLAVKRMRSGKPHRVFLWLARFFGGMVVMGVFNILEAEGIRLGGLVVVAGAFAVLATVLWVVKALGARKKAEPDSFQSEALEPSQEVTVAVPIQNQEEASTVVPALERDSGVSHETRNCAFCKKPFIATKHSSIKICEICRSGLSMGITLVDERDYCFNCHQILLAGSTMEFHGKNYCSTCFSLKQAECKSVADKKATKSPAQKEDKLWLFILAIAFFICIGLVLAVHFLGKKNVDIHHEHVFELPAIESTPKGNDQYKYNSYQAWLVSHRVIQGMVKKVLREDDAKLNNKKYLSSAVKIVALIRFFYYAPGARGDVVSAYGDGFAARFDIGNEEDKRRMAGQKLLDEFYSHPGDEWNEPLARFNQETETKASNPREAWGVWIKSIPSLKDDIEMEKVKMTEVFDL